MRFSAGGHSPLIGHVPPLATFGTESLIQFFLRQFLSICFQLDTPDKLYTGQVEDELLCLLNVITSCRKEEIFSYIRKETIPSSQSFYVLGMLNGDIQLGWLVGGSEAANSMLLAILIHIIQPSLPFEQGIACCCSRIKEELLLSHWDSSLL